MGSNPTSDTNFFILFLQNDLSSNCFENPEAESCIKLKTTLVNSVKFTLLQLESGQKYFICARTRGSCETMSSCSNGFVVDLEPPTQGQVKVMTMRGLSIPVDSHVKVTWSAFNDVINAQMTGYVQGIRSYELALGKQ